MASGVKALTSTPLLSTALLISETEEEHGDSEDRHEREGTLDADVQTIIGIPDRRSGQEDHPRDCQEGKDQDALDQHEEPTHRDQDQEDLDAHVRQRRALPLEAEEAEEDHGDDGVDDEGDLHGDVFLSSRC